MIWIILLAGLALRSISLNQSLWFDEGINIEAAKSFSFFGMITQYAVADFHPPGWFAILWVWGKLFGYSEIVLRIPSVIFGTVTVYITYLLGGKLVSKNLGLLAALLLSINPLHIYYSQEARMYALASLAVSINMLLFINLIKSDKGNKGNLGNMVVYVLSNLFVFLSDYVAYLVFPAQLIFLLFVKRDILRRWFSFLIAAAIVGIWWVPIFLRQLDIGSSASANLPTWKFVAGAFDLKTIPLTFVKFIIGRISLADKIMYATLLLPVVSLFAYIGFVSIKNLSKLPRSLLLAWTVIPIGIATIISLLIPVYSYFRVLFIIPAFVILIASGILFLKKKLRYIFLIAIVVIQLFCSLVYLLIPSNQREDWKGLVAFFKKVDPQIILLESSGTFPAFEYYAQGTLNARGALKDFPAKDKVSVVDLKEYKEVYLVDYLVQISDPNRFVANKLRELGYRQADTKDFHGVGFVFHYVK